jgi:hypothetical protein
MSNVVLISRMYFGVFFPMLFYYDTTANLVQENCLGKVCFIDYASPLFIVYYMIIVLHLCPTIMLLYSLSEFRPLLSYLSVEISIEN